MITKEDIIKKLKKVKDPELMIDVYTLGLIYGIELKGKNVVIKMTFTTPLCPYGQVLVQDIENEMKKMKMKPKIDVVFEPPWIPSEKVKEMLGIVS